MTNSQSRYRSLEVLATGTLEEPLKTLSLSELAALVERTQGTDSLEALAVERAWRSRTAPAEQYACD